MTPVDLLSVTSAGADATLSRPELAAGHTRAIEAYFNQLKAPYLSLQNYIRKHLHAESERLHDCNSEMLLCSGDKQRMIRLKQKARSHEAEIAEMQAGLNWSIVKLRQLEQLMEEKIQAATAPYSAGGPVGSINVLEAPASGARQ